MGKAKRFFLTIAAVLASFLGTLILLALFIGEEPSDLFIVFFFVSLLVVPVLTGILVFKKVSSQQPLHSIDVESASGEPYPETPPMQISTQKKHRGFVFRGKLQLVSGLMDLPQGSICKVRYNSYRITFFASGQEFSLDSEKMLDVSVMTPAEIQKQYVSSLGGAVAGSLLMGAFGLGPLGAIIGGSASQKTIRLKRKYLVITYVSHEETRYIVFDVTTNPAIGNRIRNTYRYLKKAEAVKVEL